MDFSLKEKTAIVVGGSKGLGFGMATGLAQAGANVVLVSRNQGSWMMQLRRFLRRPEMKMLWALQRISHR